ncbi:MAG: AMP-binding protein [Cytophagales bacterium]|nr:AMP-binding protein [Cytophagales bacterium]
MTIRFLASGNTLTFDQLTAEATAATLTEYETLAWRFCYDWLFGWEQFTLNTSGSTGPPKPIALTRRQMAASAAMTGQALGLQPGDTVLVNLSVRYIAGMMMLVRGLELGLHLTVVEPTTRLLESLPIGSRFDFQSYVPLQIEAISQMPEGLALLNTAKAILVGGAPVSPVLEEKLQAVGAPVYQTYGMTETVSHVALRRLNGSQRHDFYTALPGVAFVQDERGCLVIQTPHLHDNPLVTNDVVELLSAQNFRWLGRADNVINSGGVKVQAETVEAEVGRALAEMGLARRFFVAGLPDARLGEAVALVLEGEKIGSEQEEALLQSLKSRLPRYHAPVRVVYVPVFAETPTAKIDRKKTLTAR